MTNKHIYTGRITLYSRKELHFANQYYNYKKICIAELKRREEYIATEKNQ